MSALLDFMNLSQSEREIILHDLLTSDPVKHAEWSGVHNTLSMNAQIVAERDALANAFQAERDALHSSVTELTSVNVDLSRRIIEYEHELARQKASFKLLEALRSGSNTAIYHNTAQLAKTPQHPNFYSWNAPSDVSIKNALKAVKAIERIAEVNRQTLVSENNDLHPVMVKVFKAILEHCNEARVHVQERPVMSQPFFCPDIACTNMPVAVGWSDIFVVTELKLPPNETGRSHQRYSGAGQMLNYYSYVITSLPENDRYKNRVGIFSDFETVCFAFLKDADLTGELVLSSFFPLFEDNWYEEDMGPSEGFKVLCHALTLPMPTQIPFVIINGTFLPVRRHLQRSAYRYVVCEVMVDGRNVVVKKTVENDFYARGLLQREHSSLLYLYSQESMKPYVTKPCIDLSVPFGFAMEYGIPLERKWKDLELTLSGHDLVERRRELMLNAFDGLHTLHQLKWFHGDVRPMNMVVVGDTTRLIDWASADRYSESTRYIRTGYEDIFWADESKTFMNYAYHWDLYGLGYSFVYVGTEANKHKQFRNASDRRVLIASLAQGGGYPVVKAAALFILHLDTLQSGEISQGDYDALRAILRG